MLQKLSKTNVIAIGSTIKHYPLCHPMQFGFNVLSERCCAAPKNKFTIFYFLIMKLLFIYDFFILVKLLHCWP